jgi:hypothetical protein
MRIRRSLTVACAAVALLVAVATQAWAHQGVLLDESDRVPFLAPQAVDGTDEFAWFGKLTHPLDVRSFQMTMLAGQPLLVRLAIPDKAPENTLAKADQPAALVLAPNGTTTVLAPETKTPFHTVDFGGLDLLMLKSHASTAQSGVYTIVVSGAVTSRFVVATGVESDVFHGLLRGVVVTDQQVQTQWYNAP